MRKTIPILILSGLLFAGCSSYSQAPIWNDSGNSASHTSAADQGQSERPITFGETYNPPTSAAQTRRERYVAGAPADSGVVISGYTNEKRSENFTVSNSGQARPAVEERKIVETAPDAVKFKAAIKSPLSTFSADVDTASFANVRREIQNGMRPPRGMVRVEEMLNYFQYDLPEPETGTPFSVTTELSDCPWSKESKLMRVAIKTKSIERGDEPPRNLVFLLDVSGSMNSPDKLPLLKSSLKKLVDTLDDNDRVAIVVYASSSGLVLPSTTGDNKTTILEAIERLSAGGSTNGGEGIQLAYQVAERNKSENSVNRVILATDGDFNVGISSRDELKAFIEEKRKSGLYLSVLGFGRGGNDKIMETLADNGNGNYASIDSLNEARKVLVQEVGATLITVAKDVKFQVAFDPKQIESYRLIGYKNRRLADRDFDDDTKDAGELGAGHAVTALYEIKLKHAGPEQQLLKMAGLSEPALVRLRYKAPDSDTSTLMKVPVTGGVQTLEQSSADHQWAAAVAGYGMLLEDELTSKQMPYQTLYSLMKPVMSNDPDAYQSEFYSMVKKTEGL